MFLLAQCRVAYTYKVPESLICDEGGAGVHQAGLLHQLLHLRPLHHALHHLITEENFTVKHIFLRMRKLTCREYGSGFGFHRILPFNVVQITCNL
jgi:hypothetical protein